MSHISHTTTCHTANFQSPTDPAGTTRYTVISTSTTTTDPKEQHFFLEIYTSQPNLRLHIGPNTNGPVIGVSKYKRFSQDCQISLFENKADKEINRESGWKDINLVKKGDLSPNCAFQARLRGELGQFSWEKTKSMGRAYQAIGKLEVGR